MAKSHRPVVMDKLSSCENCISHNMCNWQEKCLLMESTTRLSWAWGKKIHLGLELNEEPMEGNDVDDQLTPIFKPVSMPNYYYILCSGASFRFFSARCDEHAFFLWISSTRCQFPTSTNINKRQ